jgi:Cytochrome P460
MKTVSWYLIAIVACSFFVTAVAVRNAKVVQAQTTRAKDEETAPIFGVRIPPGYRDWKVISVAHEAGNNNDLRVILGNDLAIQAYRDGKLPFPDGAIIARIAWAYVSSSENNKVFGRNQSFVAGSPINLQLSVKDSRRYGATGGWGFAQFKDGKAADRAVHETCLPCHQEVKNRDFVFTRYSPSP